jgi:hypothetical protein
MKVTRFAALAALVALAGACSAPSPTESFAPPAQPSLDGGNGLGSGNFVPGDDDGDENPTTTSGTGVTTGGGDGERGGNGLGSGN